MGRLLVPVARQPQVALDAITLFVLRGQQVHRAGITALGGFAEPVRGALRVLGQAAPQVVRGAHRQLRVDAAMGGGELVPVMGQWQVAFAQVAVFQRLPQRQLGRDQPARGGTLQQIAGQRPIGLGHFAAQVHHRQVVLCHRHLPLRQRLEGVARRRQPAGVVGAHGGVDLGLQRRGQCGRGAGAGGRQPQQTGQERASRHHGGSEALS